MNKEIKVRIILRHNSTDGWKVVGDSEVLYKGEIGLEYISGSNIPKIKIGDGISPWNRLNYFKADIPEKYTWSDLLGLKLETDYEKTPNLKLKKPNYQDTVNLKDLNGNYDILDSANQELLNLIRATSSRIDNLILNASGEEGIDVSQEVYDMRVRYSEKKEEGKEASRIYTTAGEAMRAIDEDLSKLSAELSSFIGSSIPDGLFYQDNLLYLTSGGVIISAPVEVVGGAGGGGSSTSYAVRLTRIGGQSISVAAGNPVELKFKYSSMDSDGYTDGDGLGALTVNNVQQTTFIVSQNDPNNEEDYFTIDVAPYLQNGSNNVKIQVTNSEGAYGRLSYNINILVLSITSPMSTMNIYNSDSIQNVSFQYVVTGSGTKTIHFLMNGTEIKTESITSSGQNRQYQIPAQPDGAHIFETYATSGEGENLIQSNKIRIGMIWYSNKTNKPIILFNSELKEITQGETITLPYIVFHPDVELAPITREILYDKPILDEEGNPTGQTERTVYFSDNPSVGRESLEWTTQDYPAGDNVEFKITCGTESASTLIKVLASTFDREIYTDNLLLEFNANGRENTDLNPAHWNYGDIEATFSDNISWSKMDGWLKDKDGQSMLRLLPKSNMYIPFMPFNTEISDTGYTIEIEMATQNVNDYDSIIASSFTNDRGLLIKSQSALLKSSQPGIEVQFKEDQRIRLTFVVGQSSSDLSRLISVYINGILCGIQTYGPTASFNQVALNIPAVGVTIGAESCGIDVYFIRFYNTAFTAEMQLNNYMVDRSSLTERIEIDQRNDIIKPDVTDVHKKITIDSLKGSIPYIVMQCPELPQFKGDKKKGMTMYYVDPKRPEKNFTARGVQFDVQGTSSQEYPVKNFKNSCKDGITYDQNGRYAEGFEFTDKSLTSQNLCLKADYASSENANNVCLVDLYNSITPYIMPAQIAEERVRQGIYGQPILLFWENTNTKEISFEGKYNMNDDKSNENVFGFTGVDLSNVMQGITPRVECWEWLNNNQPGCLFLPMSDWDTDWGKCFEPRFPDEDPMYKETDALERMVSWVISTATVAATNIALPESRYYLTRDIEWNQEKVYYINEEGTVADIVPTGKIISYNSNVFIDGNIFYNKMGATSHQELVGGYSFKRDNNTQLWSLYKGENTIPEITEIDTIGQYGVAITDLSITSFSFEYRIGGKGWSPSLYEKFDNDTADYRLSKFKNEFSNYFELDAMLFYYIFTETFLMIDSRAKNMFLTTFDGIHWFPIPYDMDTALGINNEGQLIFDYNLEDTDYISGKNVFDSLTNALYYNNEIYKGTMNFEEKKFYLENDEGEIIFDPATVFNSQSSTLWINFRLCFGDEIAKMYQTIRSNEPEFSSEGVCNKMNTYQSAWPEIIWNLDQEIKYLQPFWTGIQNNLAMAQGNKQAQRDFWTYNTFKYRDSKYQTGDALTKTIVMRIYNKGEIQVTPYSHIYARVAFGNGAKDETKRTWRNQTSYFNTDGLATVNDLETTIYSADRISDLGDLSDFKVGYCNFSNASKLRRIILGKESENYINNNLFDLPLGSSDLLQEINVSNCANLKVEINASLCPCLEIMRARGSSIPSVSFSNGGRLRIANLPETITNLTLLNQTELEELTIDSYSQIGSIDIENTPNVPFEQIIFDSTRLAKVRLYNIEWETTEDRLNTFIDKLSQEGVVASVVGRVNLPALTDDNLLFKVNDSFPELIVCVNGVAKYFLNYKDSSNATVYSYIAEEGSDAIDPIERGFITEDDIALTESTEDTRYFYNGWEHLPTDIRTSWTIRVLEGKEFRVCFYDANNNLYEQEGVAQWIKKGENANDPVPSLIPTPARDPSAQYHYTYTGWNPPLVNITEPKHIRPTFNEDINYYTVEFYTNLPDPIQEPISVPYGGTATPPADKDVKYYLYSDPNLPSELHEFDGWDRSLTITPSEYQTTPIKINALFLFNGSLNDISWTEIAENAAASGTKEYYGLGSLKDFTAVVDGISYTITAELVAINFDKLTNPSADYNNGSEFATYTFIIKDIHWTKQMNGNDRTFIDPKTGLEFVGYTAGGWLNSQLREWSNGVFFNSIETELKNIIKSVKKIGDIGRPGPDNSISNFEENLITTDDYIWIPSSAELGLDIDELSITLPDQQTSQRDEEGNYLSYDLFTTNQSRIKQLNGSNTVYYTRTHSPGQAFRFVIIFEDGAYYPNHGTIGPAYGYYGYLFGFCI